MSRLIADPALGDACPRCHPGDVPASRPSAASLDGDAIAADYGCGACGAAWRTWWELASVWPQRREITKNVNELLDELIAALASLLDGEPVEEGKAS